MRKRGVSAVVATVLLVLIVFVAIGLVWGFIVPMIKENLAGGKSCFDLRGYASVEEGDYSCYTDTETKLMIKRGMDNHSIEGFRISLFSEGSSQIYDITEENPQGVAMLTGGFEIPGPGEARTYVFPVKGNKAELGIITKTEKICKVGSYNIPSC